MRSLPLTSPIGPFKDLRYLQALSLHVTVMVDRIRRTLDKSAYTRVLGEQGRGLTIFMFSVFFQRRLQFLGTQRLLA